MENYAKRLALEHNIQGNVNKKSFPIITLEEDFKIIRKAFEVLSESISLNIPIPPSGEWILDNFYVIEEQVSTIEDELKIKRYIKLPGIKGKARIYLLAKEMVSFLDGNITKDAIERFIVAYQSKRKISMEELWVFPVMLKICLINYIRVVSEKIIASQYQKFKVASIVERIIKNEPINKQHFSKYKSINLNGEITSYVEFLVYLLKKEGKKTKRYINILNEEIQKAGTTLDEIIKTEHFEMALRRVSMSNSITSIKNILRYNWIDIFETINGIEKVLNEDIWYKKSDFDTKSMYRNEIQKIAKKTKLSENYIVTKLIELSKTYEKHVGEYLIGEEKNILYEELGFKFKKEKTLNKKLFWYLVFIYVPTFISSILLLKGKFIFAIIPLSEIFILIVNKIIFRIKKPKIIPKLEKVPENVATFVIVPTLLNNKNRVKEIVENLEVFYLGNRLPNLYFALLGDASEEDKEIMDFDEEVKNVGIQEVKKLNEKYGEDKFFFLYRNRKYNESQKKWLGYERKRGMITEFVSFLLTGSTGTFAVNTIKDIPDIKYIITLDSDTELPMDTAKKLIGTIEHPMNAPVIKNKTVVKGYGLIQPKVGISMESSTASLFSKIYAGDGGIDAYSTAESNIYQDLFGEAIFTGKGIFNIRIFDKLLKNEIPENTVLSHDLLEGSYIRCGLASDIEVIDGFPARVNSYMLRQHRWTRGDWQIFRWIFKSPLNKLSKYKIFDNLRRSLLDIFLLCLIFNGNYYISFFVLFFQFFVDVIERFFNHQDGIKAKNYLPIINGIQGSFFRCFLNLMLLPYKAVLMFEAIIITLYRVFVSKSKLLEWVTAADSERILGKGIKDYIKEMIVSPIIGIILVLTGILRGSDFSINVFLLVLWSLTPIISFMISIINNYSKEKLSTKENNKLKEIAKRTWTYFYDYMSEENNFLPPDNYQLGRKEKVVNTTSSTNIGLGLMAILAAYDMQFVSKEECLIRLKKSIETIVNLEKWNGHLYNWYNVKTLVPLYPRFVSTVDSGNFVGYLYVVKEFFKKENEFEYEKIIQDLIKNTNFSKLYDTDKDLFSIGYDVRENKLIDSYYDLLASEARLASFVAIAKRDVPYKHWFSMSRTLTTVDRYKGLVSWSGTMFEYFMPLIVMKSPRYTLLDETYEFCIYSQQKYSRKLNIPWGISESAFNLQDLNYNYQYKAFGIPWLGLKRGLKEEIVVAPYSSFLALDKVPRDVMKNVDALERLGGNDKYGFYDAIDFTPNRVNANNHEIVKTYMAHHQALILLSINNFLNDDIFQKRFHSNEEIKSAELLLQERVPMNVIFTKKKKEKVKILKYQNYEEHVESTVNKLCGNVNIQSNSDYTLLINDFGEGFSQFEDILLTKYKEANKQGVCVYIKDLESGEVISNMPYPIYKEDDEYEVKFSPSQTKFYRRSLDLEVITKVAVSSEENIEIRDVEITNISQKEMTLDIISYVEPVIANKNNDIVHPAYNNLFFRALKYEDSVILEKRSHSGNLYYINFLTSDDSSREEIELDKCKVIGRLKELNSALILDRDVAFSNDYNVSTNTIISFKKSIKLGIGEKKKISYYYGVSRDYSEIMNMYKKYKTQDADKRLFELAYSKSLVENRFLGYKGKDIIMYNKLFAVMNNNSTMDKYMEKIKENYLKQSDLWRFGISGDLPIIMVKINRVNDIYVVRDLMLATEYFFKKRIFIDLVILNEEENKYEQYVQDKIYEAISSKGLNYLLHKNGGIHVVKKNDITKDEENLLLSCSELILDSRDGFLKEQLYE